jgi:uncharacterized protein YjbI with pentapeptide repeats
MVEEQEEQAVKLLEAINEASRAAGARYATFLAVIAFLAVSTATLIDEMLVRQSYLTLPLLEASIPVSSGLFSFFTLVPWFVFLLHLNLLLQFSLLADKVQCFEVEATQLTEDQSRRLHERLAHFYFVLFITGKPIPGIWRWILGLGIWISLMIIPMILLLWIQIRYLPYHNAGITWIQKVAVMADILLLGWFGWRILWHSTANRQAYWLRQWQRVFGTVVWVIILLLGAVFSLFLANIPDPMNIPELIKRERSAWSIDQYEPSTWEKLDKWWFELRNLDLREKILTANQQPLSAEVINALRAGDVIEKKTALEQVIGLNLQSRNLDGANLFHAALPRADFRGTSSNLPNSESASLKNANLAWAQMQYALLDDAQMQGANLSGAQLQWASLKNTQLKGANLSEVWLQGANLSGAQLQEANLRGAHLEGADLSNAHLQVQGDDRVDLSNAHLQGANLSGANFQGANLSGAELQGANLSGAKLQDADLSGAQLQGAILYNAYIEGAQFNEADLSWADVRSIYGDDPLTRYGSEHLWLCINRPGTAVLAQSFKQCAKEGDLDRYFEKLKDFLVKLSCSNFYIARGIVEQVIKSKNFKDVFTRKYNFAKEKYLAKAMLEAEKSKTDCSGIQDLPDKDKEKLKQFFNYDE